MSRTETQLDAIIQILNEMNQKLTAQQAQRDQWKQDPATDKQMKLLSLNSIPYNPTITKGEASALIDEGQKSPGWRWN